MSAATLNILFSLSALAGLVLIVAGIRMKRVARTSGSGTDIIEPEIILAFSDLEPVQEILEGEEKKPFKPGEHQPERIEALKKP